MTFLGSGTFTKTRWPTLFQAAVGLLLTLIVIAVYWPGLGGGFVFDDLPNIVDNVSVHVSGTAWHDWYAAALSSPASSLPRPLAMLSFAANHYFTGLDPWPMKLTNVLMHAANALLVAALLGRLLGTQVIATSARPGPLVRPLAWFGAAIWALHPINLMAVLYIVQRMESLSHLFVFAGLLLFVVGRKRQITNGTGWTLVAAGLVSSTIAGVMAKESAALLPLYAFGIELFVFRFRTARAQPDRRLFLLYLVTLLLPAVLAITWLLPRALEPAAYASRNFTLVERLLTEPRVVIDYLHWTLLPNLNQLSLYHDDYLLSRSLLQPPGTLVSMLVLVASGVLAWRLRRAYPLLGLGVFWFLAAHVLTATFIPLELVFEHRNYFASLGICLVLVELGRTIPRGKFQHWLAALLAGVFVVLLAMQTHLRAREWSDPIRFSFIEANKHPQSPRATYSRAHSLILLTGYRPDSPYLDDAWTALEQARAAPGSGILPHQAALTLAARSGQPLPEGWVQDLFAKLRDEPIGPEDLGAVGALTKCVVQGLCGFSSQMMLGMYEAALSSGPQPEILSMYGDYALNVLGDPRLALRLWLEAVELRPNESAYRISLARLLVAMGREREARAQIAELRSLGLPGQFDAVAESLEAGVSRRRHRK